MYTVNYMYMPTRKCLNNIGKQGKFLKRQGHVIATISCYSKNIKTSKKDWIHYD